MAKKSQSITELLDDLNDNIKGDTVSIGDVFAAFGQRAYGPILFILALICFSPIGSIPGASIVTGTLIILTAVQYFFKSGEPWIPDFIRKRSVSANKAKDSLKMTKPYLKKIDNVFKPRLEVMTRPPVNYIAMAILIVLSITMFPLAFVPYGVTPSSAAILLISIALVTKDGCVMTLGLLGSLGALYAAWIWLM